jgi:hypothetical protein
MFLESILEREYCLFWGFQSRLAEGSVLLGCDTTSVDNKILTFQGNIMSLSSRVNRSFFLGPTEDTMFHETLGSSWHCNISQRSRIIWIYVLCQGGWMWRCSTLSTTIQHAIGIPHADDLTAFVAVMCPYTFRVKVSCRTDIRVIMLVVVATTIFVIRWVPAAYVTLHSFSHCKTMKPVTELDKMQ